MNKKYTLGNLKTRLPDYLKDNGIDINRGFRCLDPNHEDNNPSMHYSKKLEIVKCFGCGKSYNIFGLIGLEYGLKSFKEQIEKVCELYNYDINEVDFSKSNVPIQSFKREKINYDKKIDYSNYFRYCLYNSLETDYIIQRGISISTISKYQIGYDPEEKCIIIPTSHYSYTSRNIDENEKGYRYQKVGNNQIYLYDKIKETDKPIFIVEGEFDALSIIEAKGNAIALGSVANSNKLIEKLEVDRYKNLFLIALDNDETGKKTSEELSKQLSKLCINNKVLNIYGNYKDANEMLQKNKDGLIKLVNLFNDEEKVKVLNKKILLNRRIN